MTGPRAAVAVVVLVLLSAGCSRGGSGAALPAPPFTVRVTMSEYRFGYDPRIPAGRVVFDVSNVGRLPHRMDMYPLSSDFPQINAQLHGPVRRMLSQFASMPTLPPGGSGSIAVDVVAGQRYALIDFSSNPAGQVDALLGMNSEFRPYTAQEAKS